MNSVKSTKEIDKKGWIPVENNLPEERQEVLVTIKMDNGYGLGVNIVYEVDFATFCKNSGYIDSACGNGFLTRIMTGMKVSQSVLSLGCQNLSHILIGCNSC